MTIRAGNFNAYKLRLDARGTTEWNDRVTAVKELAPDLLGLQEVVTDEAATPPDQWHAVAAQTITAFAEDCGLTASVRATPGRPHGVTMAANVHRAWYTAVLWNPDAASVVPGTYRPFGAPDFWHGLTTVAFDIGAIEPLTMVAYHGDPFRPNWRTEEARRIKGTLRRPGGVMPALVVGDFNALSAAQVPGPDGTLRYYDHEVYAEQDHDDLEYQVQEGTIGGEQLADTPAASRPHGRRRRPPGRALACHGRPLEGRPGRPRPVRRTPDRPGPRHPPRDPRVGGVRRPGQ